MSAIEEKVDISADGAEVINRYLNELNTKLIQIGISDAYTIVSEAEMLFINAVQDLNKTTKLTVEEIERIIKRHGTVDEIIVRYKISQLELDENNLNADPSSTHLIRRTSNISENLNIIKKQFSRFIGFSLTFIPVILLSYALIQLNQHDDHIPFLTLILDSTNLQEETVTTLITISLILFTFHELLTARTGKLFFTVENTMKLRTAVRAIVMLGAFSSLLLKVIAEEPNLPNRIIVFWVISFVFVELLVMARDHLPYLYPLQPNFTSIITFIKIQYLLIYSALILSIIAGITNITTSSKYNLLLIIFLLLLTATLLTIRRNYEVGLRFYALTIMIPATTTLIVGDISRYMLYFQFLLVITIYFYKQQY